MLSYKKIDEGEEEGNLLRERQKEIVENMMDGFVVHSADGRILSINGAAEKFLNARYLDIKGKKIIEIENPSQLLRAVFAPMEDRKGISFSFKDNLGQELFYQIIQVPLSKKRGEILKIIRDVSRAKYLDRMKNEYITMMSHKILTPLTNIKWAAWVLSGHNLDEQKKQESVKNITGSANELIEFTAHLLNITEIEEGLFGYKFEKVDIAELAKEAIKNHMEEMLQHNLKIIFNDAKTGFHLVKGDKNRLNTAIVNYLDNAIKYTPDGGSIEVSLHEDKYTLWFVVKDTGIGVSPESTGSLFTKFFRDKKAKAIHTEGTGAGLFIVKNIIEKHGGKVGYDPLKSGGSMFYFTLPVYKEEK